MLTDRPLFSAEEFFASQPPPARLQEHIEAVRSFVERNASAGRRVVLVTVSKGFPIYILATLVKQVDLKTYNLRSYG